jgi:hypothetical protein
MSTAGKILAILISLLAAVWVLLAASVTQLNRNGAKAIQDFETKVAKIQKELDETRVEVRKLADEAFHERMRAQSELTSLQAKQTEVEKARSLVLETLSRVKLQLDGVTATVNRSQADSKQRLAEQEAETKAKADSIAAVEKLKGENGQLLGELSGLRDKFKASLKENHDLVQKLLNPRPGPTRPASSRVVH